MAKKSLPAISLFSGALGLDLGFEAAGFSVKVAVECNPFAAETIRQNRPDIVLIQKKIEHVSTSEILKAAGLRPGEPALITAGPSCQSFSTAGRRGALKDPRGAVFHQFLRVVREARPRFFVMENVRGMLSAAVRHRPLKERGPGYPPLRQEEELGSAFALILRELRRTGYYVGFDLLNAADFGVPQTRERLFFIGSRDGEAVEFPRPTHAQEPSGRRVAWVSMREGLKGLKVRKAAYTPLTESKKKYLRRIPSGRNWRALPKNMQKDALGGAHRSWGGRNGFFRRLDWDKPAPALVSQPDGKATMLCHPSRLRPLTVQEYARLQQFPDDWVFAGGIPQQYKQAGNAVPIGLGTAVGRALRKTMRIARKSRNRRGKLFCANQDLIRRLLRRPRTILNPRHMRKVKNKKASTLWMKGLRRRRELRVISALLSKPATTAKAA